MWSLQLSDLPIFLSLNMNIDIYMHIYTYIYIPPQFLPLIDLQNICFIGLLITCLKKLPLIYNKNIFLCLHSLVLCSPSSRQQSWDDFPWFFQSWHFLKLVRQFICSLCLGMGFVAGAFHYVTEGVLSHDHYWCHGTALYWI